MFTARRAGWDPAGLEETFSELTELQIIMGKTGKEGIIVAVVLASLEYYASCITA